MPKFNLGNQLCCVPYLRLSFEGDDDIDENNNNYGCISNDYQNIDGNGENMKQAGKHWVLTQMLTRIVNNS